MSSHNLVSDVPKVRASAIELLLSAVVGAVGINLLTSALEAWLETWVTITLGIALLLVSVGIILYLRFKPLTRKSSVVGFVALNRKSKKLVTVPNYRLAHTAALHLRAAFAEKPALERQWMGAPPVSKLGAGSAQGAGHRIMLELFEYILLQSLSGTLSSHFQNMKTKAEKVATLERKDLPQILLENRLLELFSADMEDRDGFDSTPPANGKVIAQYSGDRIYSHFELKLPKDSVVDRAADNSLRIVSPLLSLHLRVEYHGEGSVIPQSFASLYLRDKEGEISFHRIAFNVEVKIRRCRLLRRETRALASWVEALIQSLERDFCGKTFLNRISWDALNAANRVFNYTSHTD